MLKKHLLAPGPTPVPPEVLLAMASPIIHHRTPQFSEIFRAAAQGSKRLFGTEQPVMMIAATGTGGMESALTNTLSSGDAVIVVGQNGLKDQARVKVVNADTRGGADAAQADTTADG